MSRSSEVHERVPSSPRIRNRHGIALPFSKECFLSFSLIPTTGETKNYFAPKLRTLTPTLSHLGEGATSPIPLRMK
jgi:hypothetical protein